MKTANITWELPTPNQFGAPLEAVEALLSADAGANFTPAGEVLVVDTQLFVAADLAIGDWIVKLVVRDVAGRKSFGVDTQFLVPDESPPGDVINVQVALS